MKVLSRPWLKVLSNLSVNISAAWLAAAFITPNFSNLADSDALAVLTTDLIFATLTLLIGVRLEGMLE
jgi:hypothetical protein